MKRLLISFIRLFDRFNDLLAVISGGIIGFTALIVIYEVIMRYLLRNPTTWVNEISEISLVYCTFLGSTWVLRLGGHTKVDIFVTIMKKRGQVIIGVVQDIFSLFFCLVFTWISFNTFLESFITQERTGGGLFSVLLWPVYLVIPFGALLLCIQLIRQLVRGFAFLLEKTSSDCSSRKGA